MAPSRLCLMRSIDFEQSWHERHVVIDADPAAVAFASALQPDAVFRRGAKGLFYKNVGSPGQTHFRRFPMQSSWQQNLHGIRFYFLKHSAQVGEAFADVKLLLERASLGLIDVAYRSQFHVGKRLQYFGIG